MGSKQKQYHRVWISNSQMLESLVVAISHTNQKGQDSGELARMYYPYHASLKRLQRIIDRATPAHITLHSDGPSLIYYIRRPRRKSPARAKVQTQPLAIAA